MPGEDGSTTGRTRLQTKPSLRQAKDEEQEDPVRRPTRKHKPGKESLKTRMTKLRTEPLRRPGNAGVDDLW